MPPIQTPAYRASAPTHRPSPQPCGTFIKKLKTDLFLSYVYEHFACPYICIPHARLVTKEARRGYPETGVVDACVTKWMLKNLT